MHYFLNIPKLLAATLLLLAYLLFPERAYPLERCNDYARDVRTAHFQYFGIDYPWWYGVAQLQKESNCRNVLSKDGVGSEGPAQITYRIWKNPLTKEGIPEVRTRKNHLRAQAFINYDCWKQAERAGYPALWVAMQIYNGGGLVLKELNRSGDFSWQAARDACRRKNITFSNGQVRNACDINYEYSKILFKYADKYRIGSESEKYPYWEPYAPKKETPPPPKKEPPCLGCHKSMPEGPSPGKEKDIA